VNCPICDAVMEDWDAGRGVWVKRCLPCRFFDGRAADWRKVVWYHPIYWGQDSDGWMSGEEFERKVKLRAFK